MEPLRKNPDDIGDAVKELGKDARLGSFLLGVGTLAEAALKAVLALIGCDGWMGRLEIFRYGVVVIGVMVSVGGAGWEKLFPLLRVGRELKDLPDPVSGPAFKRAAVEGSKSSEDGRQLTLSLLAAKSLSATWLK